MRTVKERCKNSNQRGAALVFFLFSLFAIVAILAIVIDLGRFETIIRSLQHSADAAALNAASTLSVDNTEVGGYYTDPTHGYILQPTDTGAIEELSGGESVRYANVKKIVLSILAQGEMIGLNDDARLGLCLNEADPTVCTADSANFRFDDTSSPASGPDWPNYRYMSGQRGNLKVTVQRMIFCYSDDPNAPTRNYTNLDGPSGTVHPDYCKANAVKVTMTLSNINIFFGRLLGVTELSAVTVSSIAINNETKPVVGGICRSISCSYRDSVVCGPPHAL